MGGKTYEQVCEEFARHAEAVRASGVDVIDSICHEHGDNDNEKALWYLGYSLQQLDQADCLVCLDGWQDSARCVIEALAASLYGKEVYHLDAYGLSPVFSAGGVAPMLSLIFRGGIVKMEL
jgi:hypothetical protein